MKHLLVASLLLLCHFGAFSQDVWQWLNPQPSGSICLKITFTDTQHGFILYYNGDLMRTSDQGAHWQITDRFPTATSMDIADSTGVIACSNGKLYVSSDNGSTWTLAQSSLSLNLDNPINIVSRDTFFLSGNNFYKSTDRGKTVTTLNSPVPIRSFTFLDSKTGFVGGYSMIFKTTDGGLTWINKDSVNYFRSIQFLNADTGFAFGSNDTLLRTYDGGETWRKLNIGATPQVFQFVNSKTGFTGDGVGEILRTDDGGTTWTSVTTALEARFRYPVNSLYFFDENTGFSVGRNGGISKTTNGGQTWSYYSPTYLPITAVSFPTAQTGYMSDAHNTYKTTDGGQHWDTLSLVTGSSFVQTHFSSADTGYFISTNPVREHRTTDGGQTWSLFNPASTDLAVAPGQYYFAPHSGFLSCKGQLLKTVNDGVSWSSVWQEQGNGEYLDLIFFTDSLNGFATAYNKFMKTTDGGITWSLTYTGNRGFSGLWFFDPLNGYLVDQQPGGVGFVTHDGGISFSPQQFPQYFVGAMHTIGFFNRQIGYFTSDGNGDFGMGSFGHTYKTIDGGKTWQLSIDDVKGNSIVFTSDSSVLIAGDGGQLIKSKIHVVLQIDSPSCTTPQSVPAPTVTNNAGILISSASQGNHWFLNGIEIPDAHDQQDTPTVSGDYSARIITDCTISPMSNVVNIQFNKPVPGLHIHPNPVSNQLVIDNQDGAPLEFVVMNITGESILTGSSSDSQIYINTRALPPGQYILRVRNRNTSQTNSVLFVRL